MKRAGFFFAASFSVLRRAYVVLMLVTALVWSMSPLGPSWLMNTAEAATLFYEPFNYVPASNLGGQGGWVNTNTGDELIVTAGSLSYTGLAASQANKVEFGGAGIDPQRSFAGQSSGTVYYSFILNVSNLGSLDTTGGYLAGLFNGTAGSATIFGATLWLRQAAGGYNIGIGARTSLTTPAPVFTSTVYTVNTNVLVVASYEIVTGASNDVVRLYVNPSSLGDAAPTPTLTQTNTGGTDITTPISGFFFRQDSATETPAALAVDEVRTGTTYAEVTPPECLPPPAGMINWWPGEGNGDDIRGEYNGTLQGGVTFAAGKVEQAFSFDGVDDYVDIGDVDLPSTFTIDAWIFLDGSVPFSAERIIVSKDGAGGRSYLFAVQADGTMRGLVHSGGGLFTQYYTTTPVAAGVWQHVAMVYDGSAAANQKMKFYVNGVLQGTTIPFSQDNGGAPENVGQLARIGINTDDTTPFDGLIDEVEFFSRVLSQTEIQAIFNADSGGKCRPRCVTPPSGLTSWHAGDDTPFDSIGTNHGSLVNGATYAAGKVGRAFQFDGADDYVSIPNSAAVNITGDLTIDAWVRPTAHTPFQHIVSKRDDDNQNVTYELFLFSNGFLGFSSRNAGVFAEIDSSVFIPLNVWTHVGVTLTGGTITFYVNGNPTGPLAYGATRPATTDILTIGIAEGFFGVTEAWSGQIDEVEIFNRALSATEMQAINNAGFAGKCKPCLAPPANMLGWWNGDANTRDDSGNGNNGTLQGDAIFASGKVGQAFSFDGDGDYVQVPDNPNDSLDFTGDMTVDAWIKPTLIAGDQRAIVNKRSTTGSNPVNFNFFLQADGHLAWADWNGATFTVYETSASVPLNVYSHVAVTIQGSTITFYINGVSAGSFGYSTSRSANNGPFTIGIVLESGSLFAPFAGVIDELEVFNRALTAVEIQSIVAAAASGKCKTGATATGPNVNNQLGDASITFGNVSSGGTTTYQTLDTYQAGPMPFGYNDPIEIADISTTATYTGGVEVCFNLPAVSDPSTFNQLRVLHLEGNDLVNRTSRAVTSTRTICAQVSSLSPFVIAQNVNANPTAASATISGRVVTPDGGPVEGVLMNLAGGKSAWTLTDSNGNYRFDDVDTDHFYTVSPARANFSFSPGNHSFSLVGNKTDAAFTATPYSVPMGNSIDASEFFVRQHYLDFLGREPDQGGLEYWNNEIAHCGNDTACVNQRRIDVSASFFMAKEFQETGSFVYGLHKASFGKQPSYRQFIADRAKVVGGANLEERKNALAEEWVQRDSFRQAYPDSMTAEQFVNKLFESAGLIPHTGEWEAYVLRLNNGDTRAQVLRLLISNPEFTAKEYNPTFVLMEYFAYLRRDPDPGGYAFWLDVLNTREVGNYRGMVCSFITSTEYQKRFSSVVTHSNDDCGN